MRLLLVTVAALFLFAVGMHAADVSVAGKWDFTAIPADGDTVSGILDIKDEGGMISGSLVPEEYDAVNLINPKLEGDRLSFSVMIGDDRYDVTVTVSGDKFSGTFKGDATGTVQGSRKT